MVPEYTYGGREMENNDMSLETIISSAIKIPGVKVNRDEFLKKAFADSELADIIDYGPVKAGISRENLNRIAQKLVLDRTGKSSIISFAAGIPGGLTAGVSVPADVLQFFGMNLRLAQELSYLYGAQDLWQNGEVDDKRVLNQLILYCGVMFGAAGAEAGVRIAAGRMAAAALKKIPEVELTSTFWLPLLKQICRFRGVNMTKKTLAAGVAKVIPIIGGVVAGGLNFTAMMPMANRLQKTLDTACFEYTESDMNADIIELSRVGETEKQAKEEFNEKKDSIRDKISQGAKNLGSSIGNIISRRGEAGESGFSGSTESEEDVFAKLEKLGRLRDSGVITQKEFDEKKKDLLSRI